MSKFKHDYNRVIEAVAELLEKEMGFNPIQVMRYFQIFSMNTFSNTPKVPEEERENWYYLRDKMVHNSLIFNYETGEYKLINPEFKWQGEFIEEFKKSEDKLAKEEKILENRINKTKELFVYKTLKPLIKWYFSCPFLAKNLLPSPSELVLMVLKKHSKGLKINENENLEDLRDSLFDAYYYEENQNNIIKKDKI